MGSKLITELNRICTCGKGTDTFDPTPKDPDHKSRHMINLLPNTLPQLPEQSPHIAYMVPDLPFDEDSVRILINMDLNEISLTPQLNIIQVESSEDMEGSEDNKSTSESSDINTIFLNEYEVKQTETIAIQTHDAYAHTNIQNEEHMAVRHNPRLSKICNITDLQALKQAIDTNYKIHSNPITPHTNAAIKPYRGNFGSPLGNEALEKLSFEMNEQLVTLMSENVKAGTPIDVQNLSSSSLRRVSLHQQNKEDGTQSNLLHGSEEKWSAMRMEDESDAMKRELFHLSSSVHSIDEQLSD